MRRVLDPETVVQLVARRLQPHLRQRGEMIFAVSYPAAIEGEKVGLVLPYNDIDVYIDAGPEVEGSARERSETEYSNVSCDIGRVWTESNVVPHSNIEINVIAMKNLSLRRLIDSFDTICVRIGFRVEGTTIVSWDVRPEFRVFLRERVLKIHDIYGLKAQQLRLPYELPGERILMEAVHDRCFGGSNLGKFDRHSPAYRAEITDRFRSRLRVCGGKVFVKLIGKENELALVFEETALHSIFENLSLTDGGVLTALFYMPLGLYYV